MAKSLCMFVFALVAVVALASLAHAIPSYRGYTGLMLVPTADALGKGDWNAGIFFEDVAEGTVNDWVANYGVANNVEIGIDRFRRDNRLFPEESSGDSSTLINAKYAFLPETDARPGVAGGLIDITDDLETTVYIVASKSLTSRLGMYEGEIITPRVHVGFGGGFLDGLFAAASAYLGNRIQTMLEWDSRHMNVGARFRVTPGLTVHAGFLDVTDRDNNSFAVGVSFGRSY